jgi:hypothetical protein
MLVDSAVGDKEVTEVVVRVKERNSQIYKDEANTFVAVHRCSYHLGYSISLMSTPIKF